MKLTVRPRARRDIILQVAYYIDQFAIDAAIRFPDAVQEAIDQVRKQPAIGTPKVTHKMHLQGLRSWPVTGFEDIRVYYIQPAPAVIRIIRILHGKRDVTGILGRE